MLSLCELRRAVRVLDAERAGARLDRIVEPAPGELLLELAGGAGRPARDRCQVLLSARPGVARLACSESGREAPARPPAFAQYLRPRLGGARLSAVRLRSEDRQASLLFEGREGRFELLLSILGPRSNLYLLDAGGTLLRSARPLSETRRELSVGEPWCDPETRPPLEGEDRFADVSDAELLVAIERHYQGRESEDRDEREVRLLARALRKARAGMENRIARLERDVASGEEGPRLERWGELLKTRLGDVKPGDREVVVRDFETGEFVPIPLDPTRSAASNLEDLFRRARKAARRTAKAGTELGEQRARLEAIEVLERDFEACRDPVARQAFLERPEVRRMLERHAPQARDSIGAGERPRKVWKLGRRELPTRLVPRRYRTCDGLEVWVGRSDEGNDVLTTRLARGNDLFLHLESSPGSHVILRTEGAGEPPRESLLEAAELAVHFSKHRKVTRASVHVAAVKDVSKPRGAKPGLVYVHRGRTIALRRSPQRLQRILGDRIDD